MKAAVDDRDDVVGRQVSCAAADRAPGLFRDRESCAFLMLVAVAAGGCLAAVLAAAADAACESAASEAAGGHSHPMSSTG
jgi:hypothetical protein